MRKLFLLFFVLIFFTGCKKSIHEPDTILVDLSIVTTNTPTVIPAGQDIVSKVTCSGPNLCYHFSGFEVKQTTPSQFEINAKATYPNSKKGDVICPQTVYYVDTVLKISTTTKGQHILKFFNNTVLLKADTVQVN